MAARIYVSVPQGHQLPESLLERAARGALQAEGQTEGELSLTFLSDEEIRSRNLQWRGHDWIPDVLSFALHDPGEAPVGDIYIGLQQAGRQAKEHGISEREELVRLVIHGTLHVLGYDHAEDPDARKDSDLFRRQEILVRRVLDTAEPDGSAFGSEFGR